MTLLPFEPERARGADPQPHLTVTEATQLIRDTLEQHVPSPLRVIGQVSNLNCRNHWFFSLKDETSVLRCVAWASDVRGFDFTPTEGTEVIASGTLTHYGPQGTLLLHGKRAVQDQKVERLQADLLLLEVILVKRLRIRGVEIDGQCEAGNAGPPVSMK